MKKTIKQCTRNENYFISSNGEVFTKLKNGELKELKLAENSSGYLYCNLNNQRFNFVAELVYETFVGDIPTGKTIEHCDGNKLNNNINNLAAVSHEINSLNKPISLLPSFYVRNNKYTLRFSMFGKVTTYTFNDVNRMLFTFNNLREFKIKTYKQFLKNEWKKCGNKYLKKFKFNLE